MGRECGPRHRGARHAQPAPRNVHLGPRSCCAATILRGSIELRVMTFGQTISPNEKAANRIWRPNKYSACLQQGGSKKGVWVRRASFSWGWKGSSYPLCVGGVVANLGYVRGWRARCQRRTEGRETMAACRAVPRRDPDPRTTVIEPRVRTHNQNMTVAAMQMAERNNSPHLS